MSDVMIKVEGLGKKYTISHEQQAGSYTSLRDVISNKTKALFGKKRSSVSKEEFWALKDVSFEIKKGEAVGIIGRNGAGKSTLLKVLSRITEPTSGRIELNGRVASLLEVGTGFHPELTGRENVYLNGAILGMSRAEIKRKFDEIVDFSGVEKFLDTPVKRYSSGMYVRLAFAVAAHLEPEILVVDEVLAVGDAEFQKKCLGKMNEVSHSEGRTVLFVSHNLGSILQLCNTGVLLNEGKMLIRGTADEVVSTYQKSSLNTGVYIAEKTKEVYLKKLELFDGNNNQNNEFRHDEDILLHLETEFTRITQDIRILVSVLTRSRQVVFSAESKLSQKNFRLRLKKNFLVRGNYMLRVIIYNPGVSRLDVIEECCSFDIIDAGSPFTHLETFDYGQVFGDYSWEY